MAMQMSLRAAHRVLGCIVGLFVVMHLANHAALFWGLEQHLRIQELLKPIYRNPIIEPLLLLAFAAQIGVGVRLLIRFGWPRRPWARLQVISGAVLALFLMQHISAALLTRLIKTEIDTNIYWAAAVVSRIEFALYFTPYYALGIFALFLHLAAFIALRYRKPWGAGTIIGTGGVFSLAIVSALSGAFFQIKLPIQYQTYLDDFWF